MSIVIVGAGPNLGAAIARRFGREGMPVGLVSRNREKLELLAEDLAQRRDHRRLRARRHPRRERPRGGDRARWPTALARSKSWSTPPCPAGEYMKPVLETTVDDVRAALEFSVLGAVAAVTTVIAADARTRLGHDPVHHRRRGDQPEPGPHGRRHLLRRRGRLRADAPRRTSRSRHPRRAHRDRRQHRARTETTNPTTSPTSSGATTPSAATSRSGSASGARGGER